MTKMTMEQLGRFPLDNEDLGACAYCYSQELVDWELHSEGVLTSEWVRATRRAVGRLARGGNLSRNQNR
jgi:hypothetical protein